MQNIFIETVSSIALASSVYVTFFNKDALFGGQNGYFNMQKDSSYQSSVPRDISDCISYGARLSRGSRGIGAQLLD